MCQKLETNGLRVYFVGKISRNDEMILTMELNPPVISSWLCGAVEDETLTKNKYKMEYYIQNTDAGYLGNAIIFWAQGRSGYTANLDKAHKFTEEEARKICNGDSKKNKAWEVDYIDNNKGNQRVTDSQHLDYDNIKKFTNDK